MSDEKYVTLDSLVGLHTIDAVGEFIAERPRAYDEDARVFMLRIDGVVHVFAEDASDGYRSSLDRIERVEGDGIDDHKVVPFEPMVCNFVKRPGDVHDMIGVISERSGLGVLEVGTDNYDDYYPTFIARWSPEGFSLDWLEAP